MQNNISISRAALRYTPIAAATFNVNLGVAGYVDTDVSATTGTNQNRYWLIIGHCGTWEYVGARAHGSAIDSKAYCTSCSLIVKVDASGHMDLYRNPSANAGYTFIGYFTGLR